MCKLTLFIFISFSIQGVAQKSFFGVDVGANVANQRVRSEYFQSGTYVGTGFFVTAGTSVGSSPMISTSFFQNIVRPTAGLFYQLGLGEKMAIRFKAQYLALGYKNKGATPDRLKINYLCLPITFHYSITPKLTVGVGPYLCFTLGGTKINGQEITNVYHKNDNGLTFGFEYDIYKNLALGTYYIFGLKNIWLNDNIRQPYVGSVGRTEYTNRALQFTLIYKFKKTS